MFALLALLTFLMPAPPSSPAAWSFACVGAKDGLAVVEVKAELEPGWHLYALDLPSDQGPIPTSITLKASKDYALVGPVLEPVPVEAYDDNFAMLVRYHAGSPTFTLKVKPLVSGAFDMEGEVVFMVCNDKTCLPPVAVPFRITVPAS
jgi:DsbC/DsbD-like thiol-disulfide interchange protein